jgi:glyoxylase-like metal-dependent hydrolase (beta-lactamase superfamily II)
MNAVWEVYALRYAETLARSARENFIHWHDIHDSPMPLDYFVWLLRRGDRVILVDTGFNEAAAAARGRRLLQNPVDLMEKFGVHTGQVRDVVLTHFHYDHAGNVDRFPNATFHVQDREMSYATGRCMCEKSLAAPFSVEDVTQLVRNVYAGRVAFHDGHGSIAEGVEVHRTGGHSEGLQIVTVETQRGRLVLASDASHFYANMERENPFPIVVNVADMLAGWRLIRKLSSNDMSRVIPGHDPLVSARYPRASGHDDVYVLHESQAVDRLYSVAFNTPRRI